jgi:hypothetical protein
MGVSVGTGVNVAVGVGGRDVNVDMGAGVAAGAQDASRITKTTIGINRFMNTSV